MAEKTQQDYMKEMSVPQRLGHLWSYHKWIILAGVGLTTVALSLCTWAGETPDHYMAEVVLVNAYQEKLEDTLYFDNFITSFGYDPEYDHLYIDSSLALDLKNPSYSDSSTYQILSAMFLTGETDLFLSDEPVFEMLAENSGFLDLRQVLPEDLLEKYQDKLYFYTDGKTGESVPAGVWLDESAIYTEEKIFTDTVPIAGIGSQSSALETDVDLLLYLLDEY